MTARTGMATLITELRAFGQAGTAEYTLGSETYFTDDHLEDILDQCRDDRFFVQLVMEPREGSGNDSTYHDYYFSGGYWEEASGGTAVWMVQDSTGADAGTANYTVNYRKGHVRFTADTEGTVYYLTGRKYDMNRAAAQVWRQKAANVANRYDVKTDNHDLKRSQLFSQYMKIAMQFEREAPARVTMMTRVDVNG